MTINQHLLEFAGLPVVNFDPEEVPQATAPVAWRLNVEYEADESDFRDLCEQLLATVDPASVQALIIGEWGEAYDRKPPIDLLVELAPRLTALRAIFLGEMTFEQCEISWINQGDVAPLLVAYPGLEILRVRGALGLGLTPLRHDTLRELAFESGGLPGTVVREVGECDLPALTHLELWLGSKQYGGDATVEDLAQVLAGTRFPALRYLGLRDAEIADQVAAALAGAPVVARLEELDLSLGMLSDDGATALLAGQPLTHLRRLDLHHHFIGEKLAARLTDELPGAVVDLTHRMEPRKYDGKRFRYVAVAE